MNLIVHSELKCVLNFNFIISQMFVSSSFNSIFQLNHVYLKDPKDMTPSFGNKQISIILHI